MSDGFYLGASGADADDFRAHRGLGRYHDHGAGDGRREHEREDDQRDVVLRHKHSAGDDQHSPDTHHGERADRREPLREGAHLRLVRALGERGGGASVTGSLTTTGDVTAGGISLQGHVHTCPDGETGTPH